MRLPVCLTALVVLATVLGSWPARGLAQHRPRAAAAPRSVLADEADRLWAAARARRADPTAAIELWRLDRLGGWLAPGLIEARLTAAASDRTAAPLYRVMAHWLLRERAERRLDTAGVAREARALGLLDGFAFRPGPAPRQSTAPLVSDGFRRYPSGAGGGELWLEAFLRPAQETAATVVTRLSAPGGPAVLRLGYDDAVTVWLNGDEIYRSEKEHPAWLDQAAVPVRLRAGDNRLVVEVRQRSGAWRLLVRVTDPRGEPLPDVAATPDPWGEVPEPAEGAAPLPDEVVHLYALYARAESRTPPDPAALRDLADYAQAAALPDGDRLLPRVAVESAVTVDPGPRSLRAWLELLPEPEQAAVRAAHPVPRPLRFEDVYSDLALRLDEAWGHFHARRFLACRELLEAVRREAPDFLPAVRLEAILLEELGLPNQAVSRWESLGAPTGPASARSAWRDALRSAGRTEALHAALGDEIARGDATADELYQRAMGLRARGAPDAALALLDRLALARPELWGYLLEAVDIEQFEGRRDAAAARLNALLALAPDDPGLLARRARAHAAAGETSAALAALDRALGVDPSDAELRRYREALSAHRPPAPLGPPLESLLGVEDPPGAAAHVLYHHARAEVAPTGLAIRRVRRVVRVLTAEGARQLGTWEVPYTPGTQRLEIRVARALRPGEPPRSPRRSDRDLSAPDWRMYYDLRAEVLSFPQVAPGDVVEVEWHLADLDPDPSFPGYFGELAYLQEGYPRALSRVEFDSALPLQAHLESAGVTVGRPAPLVFEARGVPGLTPEPLSPGQAERRAYVHVSTLDGWGDATSRYRRLLAARDAPDDRLAVRARSLIGDARTAEEKVRRLFHAVASGVRYVGLELGTHSYQPESPHVTLARAFGDCKDKATLLIALLRAVDVEAHFVLVRTRGQGNVAPRPASFALFDHALVYLPGLDRFVDPTQDRSDPFALPPPDQGASGFVLGLDAGLRTLPALPAAETEDAWALTLAPGAGGSLVGDVVFTGRGHRATEARLRLEAEATRAEVLAEALSVRFPGARLEAVAVTGLSPADDPLVVRARVTLPAPAAGGMPRAGRPWQLVEALAGQAVRTTSLRPGAARTQTVRWTLSVPPRLGVTAPADAHLESPFGLFTSTSTVDGDRLSVETRLRLDATDIPPAQYAAFRAWLSAIDRSLADVVRLAPRGRP
jgi:transglutaminase-like putative cysteine protease